MTKEFKINTELSKKIKSIYAKYSSRRTVKKINVRLKVGRVYLHAYEGSYVILAPKESHICQYVVLGSVVTKREIRRESMVARSSLLMFDLGKELMTALAKAELKNDLLGS